MAASTIADSQIGVFRTRPFPNCSTKPSVILKAPPYSAISCPIMTKSLCLCILCFKLFEIASIKRTSSEFELLITS